MPISGRMQDPKGRKWVWGSCEGLASLSIYNRGHHRRHRSRVESFSMPVTESTQVRRRSQ